MTKQQPSAKDLKAIENFIYTTMNHTLEWKAAEQAYQNILNARSRPAPEQCPYWGIEHSDGTEWVCNRPAPAGDMSKRKKHLLYLDESAPEEFINAELMDWIYLIGDISTPYELDFVRQFGHALKAREAAIRRAAHESEYVKALVGNAFKAGEQNGTKDEREKVLDILREWSIAQYEISGVIDTMELKQKIDSLRSEEVRE